MSNHPSRAGRLLSAALIGLGAIGSSSDANAAAHADRIAELVVQRAVELRLPPRQAESTSEKARRTREAIRRGDFRLARDIAGQVLSDSKLQGWRFFPFEDFIAAIPDVTDPAFGTRLDEWVAQAGRDPVPILVRAQHRLDEGRFVRGVRFSQDVLPEHLEASSRSFARAAEDADQAIERDGTNPYPFLLKLRTLRYLGQLERLPAAFDAAQKRHPTYYRLYDAALAMLQPKWGGSLEAMRAFVELYAAPAGDGSPLKLLSLNLYRYLLDAAAVACWSTSRQNGERERCIADAVRSTSPEGFEAQLLAGMKLYDKTNRAEYREAIWQLLDEILGIGDAGSSTAPFLQHLATTLGSDTALDRIDTGRSDYIIDLAVAKSWYVEGFYMNASKKARQALSDLNADASITDEERIGAVALVSQWLARTAYAVGESEDSIASAEVGTRAGGGFDVSSLACYGYIRLKEFRSAVERCTDAVEDKPADMNVRYWRGHAKRELGDVAGATSDFLLVAGSESDLRAKAAIALSMIHFGGSDLSSARQVLEQFRYLYDPKITARADVAVAYNNLCFALMELKSLERALAACTESLKYGSLPDAQRKHGELVRLKASGAW
ncbi:MAG: hypothetical protein JO048_16105 [Methylobacteriaceae bacterium]|nr:hypothetical protein [Methylobacteriaceae bacterium]